MKLCTDWITEGDEKKDQNGKSIRGKESACAQGEGGDKSRVIAQNEYENASDQVHRKRNRNRSSTKCQEKSLRETRPHGGRFHSSGRK